LNNFSQKVITKLEAEGLIELSEPTPVVIEYVAKYLNELSRGGSLISELVSALLSCPGVDELFADDEALKRCLEDLQG
jgi:hypothetical protein